MNCEDCMNTGYNQGDPQHGECDACAARAADPICETCNGSGRFAGRVDHERWETMALDDSAATFSCKQASWQDGSDIPCPHCRPELYGSVTLITNRN